MGCQTEPLHGDDEPFRGVVLVPLDRVPVVHGELMMEVVVAFSDGDESGKEVVARGVLVVKGRITEGVREGVDAERSMMDEGRSERTSVDEPASPISPDHPRDDGGDDVAHEDEEHDVVLVLPPDDGVAVEVRDVSDTGFATGDDEHPTDVRPEETLVGGIRVEVGVGISVVGAMASGPPFDGTLDGTCACEGESDLEWSRGVVGPMSPETMVS